MKGVPAKKKEKKELVFLYSDFCFLHLAPDGVGFVLVSWELYTCYALGDQLLLHGVGGYLLGTWSTANAFMGRSL